uniref:SRR1-like domain-containing protein n=1 Tax=Parascaris univalens TaxID=6257 RepID=A0A915BIC5_PARUN
MEEDGFVLVKNRRRRRRHIVASNPVNAYVNDLSEISVQKIDAIVDEAVRRLRYSPFCEMVLSILNSAIGERRPSQIVAIGIGNFSEKRLNGAYQIALLLILMEHFKCIVRFREPLTTSNEKKWLESKDIRVEACSDLLDESIEADQDSIRVYYMPHCGHALYNNVIYAHRGALDIGRLIIVGNDMQEMYINEAYSSELAAICEYRRCCETHRLPVLPEAPFVFNDTAIHFLASNSTIPQISDHIPNYAFYASEIILKNSKL